MTTLAELQALTKEQLIEKVAVEVMGWREEGFADAWMASKARGGRYVNGRWIKMKRDFRPLTDWNHTMEVAAKMHEGKRYSLLLCNDAPMAKNDWYAEFKETVGVAHADPQSAICLAALLAVTNA